MPGERLAVRCDEHGKDVVRQTHAVRPEVKRELEFPLVQFSFQRGARDEQSLQVARLQAVRELRIVLVDRLEDVERGERRKAGIGFCRLGRKHDRRDAGARQKSEAGHDIPHS